LDYTKM